MAGDKLFYIGAKALIENGAGEILLLKTSDRPGLAIKESYWDFPGGRLKPGQTPSQALKEEILEETGINDITETGLWTTVVSNHVTYKDDNEIGLSLLVYRVSIPAGSQIVLSDEHTEYEWVDHETAKQRLAHKYPKEFIDQL